MRKRCAVGKRAGQLITASEPVDSIDGPQPAALPPGMGGVFAGSLREYVENGTAKKGQRVGW